MFLGAPMVPFLLVTGLAVMLAMLGLFVSPFIFIGVVTVWAPIYAWMRVVTKADDQRLNQLLLRLRMRARMTGTRRFWRAVTYLPLKYKKPSR